jgi:hypothetical protein
MNLNKLRGKTIYSFVNVSPYLAEMTVINTPSTNGCKNCVHRQEKQSRIERRDSHGVTLTFLLTGICITTA